jgi:hypothetical protein
MPNRSYGNKWEYARINEDEMASKLSSKEAMAVQWEGSLGSRMTSESTVMPEN